MIASTPAAQRDGKLGPEGQLAGLGRPAVCRAMLRFFIVILLAIVCVAAITRKVALRQGLFVMLGLMVLYTVLKLTGVIDAIATSRNGVF